MYDPRAIHPRYRPDIDGLRALAVLCVIGFHAFPEWVPGGFIGVDIFFVISGFLISYILMSGLNEGKFSILEFYARRVRRIFPALLVVLATVLAAGWFILTASEYKALGKYAAGGAGFVANLFFLHDGGYFGGAATSKPLLHLWSLGVEEQFYIIWPLLLWCAWKLKANVRRLLAIIAVVSFGWGLLPLMAETMAWESLTQSPVLRLLLRTDTLATFYLPQARFWELLAGAALAYARIHGHRWPGTSSLLSWLGAALIVVGLIYIREDQLFPGYWALLPVLGAVGLIAAGEHSWVNRHVLSHRAAVAIGLISYPLYLWHWPLLSFAHMILGHVPSLWVRAGCVVLTFVLAALTYRFLERPLRSGNYLRLKAVALLVCMLPIAVGALVIYKKGGLTQRAFAQHTQAISFAATDWNFPGDLIPAAIPGIQMVDGAELYTNMEKPPHIMVVGDSHVQQYAHRIAKVGVSKHIPVLFVTGGGCAAIPGVSSEGHYHCAALLATVKKILATTPSIKTVMIGGCWNGIFLGDEYYVEKNSQHYGLQTSKGKQEALASFSTFLRALGTSHRVYLLLDNPSAEPFDPATMLGNRLLFKGTGDLAKTTPVPPQQKQLRDTLSALGKSSGATVIDPLAALCPKDRCRLFYDGDRPIYQNLTHLTAQFVTQEAGYIDHVFKP